MAGYARSRSTSAAAGCSIAALALAGWTLWKAIELEPPPAAARDVTANILATGERPRIPLQAVLLAVDKDPFEPDRKRPTERFLLPEERLVMSASTFDPSGPPRALQLLGTVVLPGGSGVAMTQLGNDSPRLVRTGERIGEFTLRSILQGKAVFVTATGNSIELQVPKAGT